MMTKRLLTRVRIFLLADVIDTTVPAECWTNLIQIHLTIYLKMNGKHALDYSIINQVQRLTK